MMQLARRASLLVGKLRKMNRGDAARVVIRGMLVPFGLGLLGLARDGYRLADAAVRITRGTVSAAGSAAQPRAARGAVAPRAASRCPTSTVSPGFIVPYVPARGVVNSELPSPRQSGSVSNKKPPGRSV